MLAVASRQRNKTKRKADWAVVVGGGVPAARLAAAAATGRTTRNPVRQKDTQRNSTDVRSGKTLPISSEVRLLQFYLPRLFRGAEKGGAGGETLPRFGFVRHNLAGK